MYNIDAYMVWEFFFVSIGPPLIRGTGLCVTWCFGLFEGGWFESVLLQNGPKHPFLPLPINRQTCNLKAHISLFENEVSKGAKEKADYE